MCLFMTQCTCSQCVFRAFSKIVLQGNIIFGYISKAFTCLLFSLPSSRVCYQLINIRDSPFKTCQTTLISPRQMMLMRKATRNGRPNTSMHQKSQYRSTKNSLVWYQRISKLSSQSQTMMKRNTSSVWKMMERRDSLASLLNREIKS